MLDASAIITVAKRLGDRARHILKGNATLVLAFYEIGNFVWKEPWRPVMPWTMALVSEPTRMAMANLPQP